MRRVRGAVLLVGLPLVLGACGGGEKKADAPPPGPSSAPSVTASAEPPAVVPKSGAPTKPGTLPATKKPGAVVMIDPQGKSYTRPQMVTLAYHLAKNARGHLPPDFCAKSYLEGVKGGGKFPQGKKGYLAACQEGVRKYR
ncbi:hypothetical protein [Actinomadura macrotermitis]|uniref:Lipoprotein n=1 Tax=Actinomadura macrotermitis TaxID=2585200 RepID=A0A7K0BPR1_9ACTN|nr:hypothetical protein [Actinomadura macrotermitis]MQY03143.1 hypothetical protein [Actinomadura macrotermitis]